MLIRELRSVWVPYEMEHPSDTAGDICYDLPRFLHPEECKDFLLLNQRKLRRRLIQFREHHEIDFKQEYLLGVGHNVGWRYGPHHDPEDLPEERHSDRDY
jgi:hypothetical protein